MRKYVPNQTIVQAKIVKVAKTYVLAKFGEDVGICHISNVSDYIVRNINKFFEKEKEYSFLVINVTHKQISLSYKAIHPKHLKWHQNIIPTPKGFSNLKENLEKWLCAISSIG